MIGAGLRRAGGPVSWFQPAPQLRGQWTGATDQEVCHFRDVMRLADYILSSGTRV
jgi:hypothetical protein